MDRQDRAFNNAYILLLIRNGVVKDRNDLYKHFGIRDTPSLGYVIDHALGGLLQAGLIEYNGDLIQVTSIFAKIQTSLQFSLSALASGQPLHRLIVSPRFEAVDADRYRSDILVLMPFAEALTALYQDHLKAVAQALQMTKLVLTTSLQADES